MANIVMGGFRWIKNRQGANVEPIEERVAASGLAGGIFHGDCVKLVSDGTIAPCSAGDAVYGVAKAAIRYKNSSGQIVAGNFLPASTTYTGAPSISNPQASVLSITLCQGQVFEADVDTAQASITAAQDLMFNNADMAAGAGGNTTTGRSTQVINGAAGTGTGTAQWRLLEVVPDPLNDVTAANWKVRITLNEGTEPVPGTATGT